MIGDRWAPPDAELGSFIQRESERSLAAYRQQPNLIAEHLNIEEDPAGGDYAHQLIFELVQQSANALAPLNEVQEGLRASNADQSRRVVLHLSDSCLYRADNGAPVDRDGVIALMFSRMSPQREISQTGTFGLRFKSVLGISDSPEFFSRNGSFRFDRARSRKLLRDFAPDSRSYPVLRLPEPVDPAVSRERDKILQDLMGWATNVIRLPLKNGSGRELLEQMRAFPLAFLIFVEHVDVLTITDDAGEVDRTLRFQRDGDNYQLREGPAVSQWRQFSGMHRLSAAALADRMPGDERDKVPVSWTVPVDQLRGPGKFWACFPTNTESPVAGILRAPWKTNEDRRNLLPGRYNDELIEAGATIVADALPGLATDEDPARHLDAMPRWHGDGDSHHAEFLRSELYDRMRERKVVPDLDGELQEHNSIAYPPVELTSNRETGATPMALWMAYPGRPSSWLHPTALKGNRLAAIDQLFLDRSRSSKTAPPRATISAWLEVLANSGRADDPVGSSRAAIAVAASLHSRIKGKLDWGRIFLTEALTLRKFEPFYFFLPDQEHVSFDVYEAGSTVHPELAADPEVLGFLRTMGFYTTSPEDRFGNAITRMIRSSAEPDDRILLPLWIASRRLNADDAVAVIRRNMDSTGKEVWPSNFRVRVRTGDWRRIWQVLLPGDIVAGNQDDSVTVDTEFHRRDMLLLRKLGLSEGPAESLTLFAEPWYRDYWFDRYDAFNDRDLPSRPQYLKMAFSPSRGTGPLDVLRYLSPEAAARYTEALLACDSIYEPWTMYHKSKGRYPPHDGESPAIWVLRKLGQLRTPGGSIIPLASALGSPPADPDALSLLLRHPNTHRIRASFGLSRPVREFFGEFDPVPFNDVWPGLRSSLQSLATYRLIRCERIREAGRELTCAVDGKDVYLLASVETGTVSGLRLVLGALGKGLSSDRIEQILQLGVRRKVEQARERIRQCRSDPERLLAAVGEEGLRARLPRSLLSVFEGEQGRTELTGREVAEASIAVWHTDALRKHRHLLEDFGQPVQWAGSPKAVRFVRSLGFSDEWAGERRRRRVPFLEIAGPRVLPPLHDYQRIIGRNLRNLLRGRVTASGIRHGLISMPIGSGRTRVTVQAIVEAMRDDGLRGRVLWVADRDELCEQVVEVWRRVWSSEGAQATRLRMSRMWTGRPLPLPVSDPHVVVATIQTLNARLTNQPDKYGFLAESGLIVFDESHRPSAPACASAMEEIGLTRFHRANEPFLIGLTATPNRRCDAAETERLVKRYGSNRLDTGAFASERPEDVIPELQDMGMLAFVDHATVEGAEFSPETLSVEDWHRMQEELSQAKDRHWLPQSIEQRIAEDSERTRRIIQAYDEHIDRDWPTIIFATSVGHARTIAALLDLKGIASRAVSAVTAAVTRRRVIEEFRSGKIKVLVNYGVFGEGFDAPRTRAIIVARPVYSPNLYFRMIGRGLRGPKNGGNARCLILDVEDSIQNYEHALAVSELDWLWAR